MNLNLNTTRAEALFFVTESLYEAGHVLDQDSLKIVIQNFLLDDEADTSFDERWKYMKRSILFLELKTKTKNYFSIIFANYKNGKNLPEKDNNEYVYREIGSIFEIVKKEEMLHPLEEYEQNMEEDEFDLEDFEVDEDMVDKMQALTTTIVMMIPISALFILIWIQLMSMLR